MNSLLGRTGAVPSRTCVTKGGALHVIDDAGVLQVVERDGLILALASDVVKAEDILTAYDATAANNTNGGSSDTDTRRRVNALRATFGDLHAKKGAFALALFDASLGRVLAARTANSLPISYGFTADGTLVACAGLSADSMFPEAGATALELTNLPSGRFIFGHRYVKPIEFTQFWGTAAANRSAAPARKASDLSVKAAAAMNTCVAAASASIAAVTIATEADGEVDADADAAKLARRWGETGSAADSSGSWKRRSGPAANYVSADAAPFVPSHKANSAKFSTSPTATATALPLPTASKTAYVPPAMRKAAAAAAAAEEEERNTAAPGTVSPRTAARNVAADAQVAAALANQEHIVTSLENALVSAVKLNLSKPAFAAAAPTTTPASVAASVTDEWKSIRIPLSLRIPEEDLLMAGSPRGAVSLESASRRGGSDYARGPITVPSKPVSRLRSNTLDSASWERALQVSRSAAGAARRSMEACSRSSVDMKSVARRGSIEQRGSMEVARAGM